MIQTEQIAIPNFPGFYQSRLLDLVERDELFILEDFIEEGKLEEDANTDDLDKLIDFDYKTTFTEISKDYYTQFKNNSELELLEDTTGIKLGEFFELNSPREYNFRSDELVVTVDYDIEKVKSYILSDENWAKFSRKIQEENKSREGFASLMETDIESYFNVEELLPYQLTQVIEFFIEQGGENNLEDIEEEILDYLGGNFCGVTFTEKK